MTAASNVSNHAASEGCARQPIAAIPITRQFYWCMRRELWENRAIYIGPLAAAVLFLFGFLINLSVVRHRLHSTGVLSARNQHQSLEMPYEMAAALIMGVGLIVGVFYALDALYGERRDRSILFWKSLPVSDWVTVLSKFLVVIVVVPLVSFGIVLATQWIMLLVSSLLLLGSGVSVAAVWAHSSILSFTLMLLYHMVTVHGLWYAPIYAYFLLVSAWAPRAPFIWAFVPPFVICGVERVAFNSAHILNFFIYRLAGPPDSDIARGSSMMTIMEAMTPFKFFAQPGLWAGLIVAAALLVAVVRLRRYRGPA